MGLRRLNVTSPFKEDLIPFLDEVGRARGSEAGAANCAIAAAAVHRGQHRFSRD